MKKTTLILLLSVCFSCIGVPRITDISGETDRFTKVEIICDSSRPAVRFAADELQRILTTTLGKKPEITTQPSGDALQLILGDGPLSREAGLDMDTAGRRLLHPPGGEADLSGRERRSESRSAGEKIYGELRPRNFEWRL